MQQTDIPPPISQQKLVLWTILTILMWEKQADYIIY